MRVGFSDSKCTHAYAYCKCRPTKIMRFCGVIQTRTRIANAVQMQKQRKEYNV